ncbi:MAG: RsmB/NOP family class I SAM-dependent RNA methyltransferase [Lachnospiraceae bacterium]|nr:RsmB/NOP family class I SAM-dependent RNA methyltransferase [Lachnospiraceae bacterium]
MLPVAFVEKIKKMLPEAEVEAFLNSYEDTKFQALRMNQWKLANRNGAGEGIYESSEKSGPSVDTWELKQVPWIKNGFYYDESVVRPGKHPYHEAGIYYIQEPSAMVPGECLDIEPGMRVLDLCAAPGGKSTQLAAKLMGKGMLISNEPMPNRAKILSENVERLGFPNVVVTNAYPQDLAPRFPSFFHRIMVDAPCSGEGMFRKNELAQDEWSEENVRICHERQMEILDKAADMLAAGGQMVYSTCTFSPEENEGTMYEFLINHPEFHLVEPRKVPGMSDGVPEYLTMCGYQQEEIRENVASELKKAIRLWPHKIQGEGHFTAVLEKDGSLLFQSPELKTKKKPLKNNALQDFLEMTTVSGILEDLLYKNLKLQGDQIYLIPEECPNLSGIKVLRPGLHIGTVKKERFEPAHALALALHPDEYGKVMNLTVEQAMDYINGLTFKADGDKGWYLILVDGVSLGWGKLAGGTMKNHYPKGLRKNMR